MGSRFLVAAAIAAIAVVTLDGQAPSTSRPAQQPPTFRSRITIVPIDVRVVDREGRPITDLKREDFTILEDTVPQTIAHFSTRTLTADVHTSATAAPLELRKAQGAGLEAANRRVFLLLFGRGRLQGPSKEMPATIEFVRKQLLPQDYVAVIAYNRATDFTTNHQQVLEVLERLKSRQAAIEGLLEFHFDPRDLSTWYGSQQIPPHVQREIDAVFAEASGVRSRTVTGGSAVPRMRDDILRVGGARVASEFPGTGFESSLSDYLGDDLITMQDLDNVYGAINYLRYVEGEKHLVFVTPRGLLLPRVEDERSLAHVSSDARVALSLIYTGGVVGAPPAGFRGPLWNRVMFMSPVPDTNAVFRQTFMVQAARRMAQETGGLASAFKYADHSFDRIDRATRFQYLLGYAPANPDMDGRYRRVVVKVNRPGATVLYRRGYFATDQVVPVDRRSFVTEGRILAAGGFDKAIREIDITTKPPAVSGPRNAREVLVEGRIQSSQIAFTEVDGRRTASIDVAVYCGDRREHVVGEMRRVIELKLRDDTYEEFLKNGVEFSVRVPVSAEPRYVKVIAYDYAADVLGSAMMKLQ